MSLLPIKHDFGTLTRGDTTDARGFTIDIDGAPAIWGDGASAFCQARDIQTGDLVVEWSTAAGTLLLADGAVLLNELPPATTRDLPVTRCTCELEITYGDGRVKTWLRGPLLIEADIAKQ